MGTILLRRNSTPAATPTAAQLAFGELAINTADGRLFAKNAAGTVVNLPVTSISGQTITPSNIGLNASSPTSPLHIRRTEASSQDSAAKILSSTTTASNDANWRGRMLVGAQNKTFLMGCYANMAAIGAHNWTSADAQTGAAWTDLYVNPDGAASIYLGATKFGISTNSWAPGSGIVGIDNNTGRVNVTTGFGIDSNNVGADFKIVSGVDYDGPTDSYIPAIGALPGAPQSEILQVLAGSHYYDVQGDFMALNEYINLARFNCSGAGSRGSLSLSNSGTGAWENNVLQMFVHGTAYSNGYYAGNASDAGCAMIVTQGSDIAKLQIGNYNSAPIEFFTSNATRMRISATGDVSVGTTATSGRLTVKGAGTTSATTALNVTNSADTSLLFVRNDGFVGINHTAPDAALVVKSKSTAAPNAALKVLNSGNSPLLYVGDDGRVGINKSTLPTATLDVEGDIAAEQVNAEQVNIGTSNVLDAAATYGSIIGGLQSKASMYGEIAHASGGFVSTAGTAQHRILVARGLTLSGAFTVSIASPAVFTRNGHSLSAGDTVKFSTTGALPTGLNTTTNYFVSSAGLTANTFQVSTTRTGASVVTSGTQSGTHTLIPTTSLTLNGAVGLVTPARLVIPERSTWSFTLKLSAYSSQNNQGGAWWLTGGLRRNLSTTVELETTQGFQYAENSFGAAGALIDVAADTINNALDIRVTGIANQSVRWAAVIDIIQVSFGTP